jgi:hypothetical protein
MIIEKQIKVFISSKCGGERMGLNHMVTDISKEKKDVADGAMRTNYDLVRRSLKTSLESTGFIQTYVFEESEASTLPVQDDYFDELDTSDVCLFLIDNFDEGIPNGVLKEINRAQSQNKKSIFLFLNHPNREKTSVQHNLMTAKGLHYVEINDIREFIDEGYRSVITDILTIYQMYCRGKISYSEELAPSVEITPAGFLVDTQDISESIFKSLDSTKNKLTSLAFIPNKEPAQSTELDKLCLSVLEFLLGDKKFCDLNLTSLLQVLSELQEPKLHNLVCKRWEAISSFYSGNLDGAIRILESKYTEYSENLTMPKWLLGDILIDLRNFNFINDSINNKWTISIQEEITKLDIPIFFPLIDRFSKNISDSIIERNFDRLTSSPYTTRFLNYEHILGYISAYLFTAIYYGSYTHIVLTLEKLQEVLFDLAQQDQSLLNKISLIKVSILHGDDRDFEKITRLYKSSFSHSTGKELLDLYRLADTKPLPYLRSVWKINIFRELGYYFSDIDYEFISDEIRGILYNCLQEENLNINLMGKLLKALKSNTRRFPDEKIIRVAIDIFNKKYYRFFDSAFDLLRNLRFSEISQDLLSRLWLEVKDVLEITEDKNQYPKIESFLIGIRKSLDGFDSEIDVWVQKYYPDFYKNDYRLEIFPVERASYIPRYIDSIKARNELQGKNGIYIAFVENPFNTIERIIELNNISLSDDLVNSLLKELANTLFSETQTYAEKNSALQLLMFLKKQEFSQTYDWESYYSNIKQNIGNIEKGYSSLFESDGALVLRLNLITCRITFEDDCLPELLEILTILNNSDSREIISSLILLRKFLKLEKERILDNSIVSVFLQYISAFCFHNSGDVRFATVRALYHLIESPYSDFVVGRLTKMMDDDSFEVKWAIVEQAPLIRHKDILAFNYVVSKAQIDNNYLVRTAIRDIVRNLENL